MLALLSTQGLSLEAAKRLSYDEMLVVSAQAEFEKAQQAITKQMDDVVRNSALGGDEKQVKDALKRLRGQAKELERDFYGNF